jgi:hypothetical protein
MLTLYQAKRGYTLWCGTQVVLYPFTAVWLLDPYVFYRGGAVVGALRYKPEGRGIDS